MERRNFVAFGCGMRGTGKSTLMARYASNFPRRFIVDTAAEFFGTYSDAYECLTLRDTLDALEDAADKDRWTIVACLLPKEIAKVCGVFAPLSNPTAGYSANVGGVMIECGEIETIAPNHKGIAPEVVNLIHRGRHSLTSFAVATRRPADVNRLVTSQADVIACFQQHEVSDIEYLTSVVGEVAARAIGELKPFHHVQCMPQRRYAAIVDGKGKTVKVL